MNNMNNNSKVEQNSTDASHIKMDQSQRLITKIDIKAENDSEKTIYLPDCIPKSISLKIRRGH